MPLSSRATYLQHQLLNSLHIQMPFDDLRKPVVFFLLRISAHHRPPIQPAVFRNKRQKPRREIRVLEQTVKVRSGNVSTNGSINIAIIFDDEGVYRSKVI